MRSGSANERVVYATLELQIWWGLANGSMNTYMSLSYLLGSRVFSYAPRHENVPMASLYSCVWHALCAILIYSTVVYLALTLRRRDDAPSLKEAVAVGLSRFKAVHGRVMGTLLSTPGNAMPTSTSSYFMADAQYFRTPVAEAYLRGWIALRFNLAAQAIMCTLHYVALCSATQGEVAEEFMWLLWCTLSNVVCSVLSTPSNRRKMRTILFPSQERGTVHMRV